MEHNTINECDYLVYKAKKSESMAKKVMYFGFLIIVCMFFILLIGVGR